MLNKHYAGTYLLALAVMVAVASLTSSEFWTREARTQAQQEKIEQSLAAVAPITDYDNNPLQEKQYRPHDGKTYIAYRFTKNGLSAGYVIQNETYSAYNGLLRVLVGLRRDGTSSGVRVVAHRETPGLGDRIEPLNNPWILKLNGSAVDKRSWQLKKDGGVVDNLTGATVSARATLNSAYEALLYFTQDLEYSDTQ